jgi:hypothetical protein
LNKGFVFSLEATISVMLLGVALLVLFQPRTASFVELTVFQQENDLLKVWSADFPSEAEMISDARLLFGENVDLFIDGRQITATKTVKKNCVSSGAALLDDSLNERKFLIKAYFG